MSEFRKIFEQLSEQNNNSKKEDLKYIKDVEDLKYIRDVYTWLRKNEYKYNYNEQYKTDFTKAAIAIKNIILDLEYELDRM